MALKKSGRFGGGCQDERSCKHGKMPASRPYRAGLWLLLFNRLGSVAERLWKRDLGWSGLSKSIRPRKFSFQPGYFFSTGLSSKS
jgi:hypothetical protein